MKLPTRLTLSNAQKQFDKGDWQMAAALCNLARDIAKEIKDDDALPIIEELHKMVNKGRSTG